MTVKKTAFNLINCSELSAQFILVIYITKKKNVTDTMAVLNMCVCEYELFVD